jgi:hypothetical protein
METWTKVASVLFVDSPVGAGFSFSRNPKGYDVGEVSSSLQVKKFLTKVRLTEKKSFSRRHQAVAAAEIGYLSEEMANSFYWLSIYHFLCSSCRSVVH